ncbi:MAG: crossover junction endodeoxyribonuclease RuvC [Actinobacteria bacterium]|nr:crossover junction endodeoxyribonuclease RuvC [Actinomycetota bacterium]MCB9412428.1 crossover junction endodeoxyribonuclease RuvC [Actinomycetota bacterium]
MRVLGVDPGLTRCGIGVVEGSPGRRLALVHVEVVRTDPEVALGARLGRIDEAVAAALADFRPDRVAIERVFSQHNVSTVMGTAQAAGVCALAAHRARRSVATYTPSEVKAAVTGDGRADKSGVAFMVRRILNLAEAPRPADATDALALAITDVWRGTALRDRARAVARR